MLTDDARHENVPSAHDLIIIWRSGLILFIDIARQCH